ncbi:flagellar assembly protein FliH [Salinicola avicenniae]|uniref:flagellar assembly protein FliH n=1 Tax=Salinicola avicenniae TaxID=2916836 RepID=UPI002072EE26|nr:MULTISPECIES: flagellar assembly protein FliH [unclassified Salinicola]
MATSDRSHRPLPTPADDRWHRWQMDDLERPTETRDEQSGHGTLQAERYRRQRAAEERQRREAAEQARERGYEQGRAEGHEAGYAEGYREGQAAAQAAAELEFHKRLDLTLKPLAPLAETFTQALAQLDEDVADQLVELALIAGRQLAGESLQTNPEHIVSVVRDLLAADNSLNGKPRLWLHPDDLPLVTAAIGDTLSASGWECHADPSLERGGCRATSASGGLDATLDTQWRAVLDQRRRRRKTASAQDSEPPADE